MRMLRLVMRVTALCLLWAGAASADGLLLEVRELTGENPFARNVYACVPACTLEQFDAVVQPAGFEKASAKLFLPSSASATFPTIPGVPSSLDLVPDLPGDDFDLVARVLDGSLIGFNPVLGPFAIAQVERETQFTFDAGSVIHEVIDTDDNVYILFSFQLDQLDTIDITQVGALAGLEIPTGWSYRSRTLNEDLFIDSGGLAQIFAQGGVNSWQRYAVIPEPSTALLLAFGLAGIAAAGHLRRW